MNRRNVARPCSRCLDVDSRVLARRYRSPTARGEGRRPAEAARAACAPSAAHRPLSERSFISDDSPHDGRREAIPATPRRSERATRAADRWFPDDGYRLPGSAGISSSEAPTALGSSSQGPRCRRARRTGAPGAVAVALPTAVAAAEELDRVGDDLDGLALGSVLGLPLAPVEPALDRSRSALRQVGRAVLAWGPRR